MMKTTCQNVDAVPQSAINKLPTLENLDYSFLTKKCASVTEWFSLWNTGKEFSLQTDFYGRIQSGVMKCSNHANSEWLDESSQK